jgi:2-hydroxychromene-2-carboxylate isomerase
VFTFPTQVDFYFDPLCPFAYQTSLWIRDVRHQTGLVIDWRFFSVEEVNRKEGTPPMWERETAPSWTALRIAAWLRRREMALCDAWYAACGRARHVEGHALDDPDLLRSLLGAIGAHANDYELALNDASTHQEVRSDHEHAIETYAIFGVPTLVFAATEGLPSKAVFGPVVLRGPLGAEALELWETTARYARTPGLYELKTPRLPGWHKALGR